MGSCSPVHSGDTGQRPGARPWWHPRFTDLASGNFGFYLVEYRIDNRLRVDGTTDDGHCRAAFADCSWQKYAFEGKAVKGDPGGRIRRNSEMIDQMVMDIIRRTQNPVGAYAVARRTGKTGNPLAPVQVYRSLGRLMESGKVNYIVSKNAYVAARHIRSVFLLCDGCGHHASVDGEALANNIRALCEALEFEPRSIHVELNGKCLDCLTGQNI